MRHFACATALTTALIVSIYTPARAADITPLAPPAMDYAAICHPSVPRDMVAAPGLAGWNGISTTLSSKTLYENGKLFLYGNPKTARNARAAAAIFGYLSRVSSVYQARAKHYLATMLLDGDGIARDHDRALQLFSEALKSGVTNSAYRLGTLSLRADDYKTAGDYFLLGATRNHASSALALAHLYGTGRIASPQADSAATTGTLAETLLLENLARGECGALHSIGMIYDRGKVTQQNRDIAHRWFVAGSKGGSARSMTKLADYYLAAGTEKERTTGIELLTRAAAMGSAKAEGKLGLCAI